MNLLIDNDFRDILPPLSTEEYAELEKSVKEKGVLSPILTWNGYIVDGHNRYAICQKNGITTFEVKEMQFGSKDEVLEWILSHQLGRRNLNDFQRNEVALKYEKVIAERMRERQIENGKKRSDEMHNPRSGPFEPLLENKTSKRKELAKIAGTSEGSIQRSKLIIEHGTQEQIDRARKGGAGNSVSAIANEIEAERRKGEVKTCNKCKETLPIEMFERHRGICKNCKNKQLNEIKAHNSVDFLGNKILISDELRKMTEEEIVGDLYDTEKVVEYTDSDLEEELNCIIENFFKATNRCLELHRDLLDNEESKAKVLRNLTLLQTKLQTVKENYDYE